MLSVLQLMNDVIFHTDPLSFFFFFELFFYLNVEPIMVVNPSKNKDVLLTDIRYRKAIQLHKQLYAMLDKSIYFALLCE